MTDADREIIDAIRAGDPRSFSVLVDRHKDRAMTLAVRLVGGREEAEEIVQDSFLRAFRGLGSFRGDAKFSTWFYRILYNACMTGVRRRGAPPVHEIMDGEAGESPDWPDGDPGALERLESNEVREILLGEIAKLPGAYCAALTLFYVQELRYEEMTDVLQIPLGTVKTNLSRGRALLRKRVLARMNEEVLLP